MQRNHRATVWLRRTEEECKSWLNSFGSAKWAKIAKQAGLDPDKLRRQGRLILYNTASDKHPEWTKIIRAGAISEWADFRDTDDPAEELIYIDEAFATPEKYKRYVGNEVEHALDIFKSLRRGDGSDLRMLIAGNAENAINPWFEYFGIKEPSIEEGFLMLRPRVHGADFQSIPYERIRKHGSDDFDGLVKGTGYGAFMAGDPKGARRSLLMDVPRRAHLYANIDFGRRLSLWLHDGYIIVSLRHVDGRVLRITPDGGRQTVLLTPQIKKNFTLLRRAWQSGKIRFDSLQACEWGLNSILKIL